MRVIAHHGRHVRHQAPTRWSYLIVLLAAAAALIAAIALAGQAQPAQAAQDRASAPRVTALDYRTETPLAVLQAQLAATRARLQAAAARAAATYTVRPGDSLSSLARTHYGSAALWPALWWINKAAISNPNLIATGQVLKLSSWHPQLGWLDAAAMRAIPAAPPAAPVRVVTASTYHGTYHRAYYHRSYSGYSGSVSPSSSYEACVISRESGGRSQVMNSSGHYGLYQFDYGTWVSGGGSGADFGHASPAEQQRVFRAVYAARGTQPWSPSDGC